MYLDCCVRCGQVCVIVYVCIFAWVVEALKVHVEFCHVFLKPENVHDVLVTHSMFHNVPYICMYVYMYSMSVCMCVSLYDFMCVCMYKRTV